MSHQNITSSTESTGRYSDAPPLHPNFFMAALQLLGWLIFHPTAWKNNALRQQPPLPPHIALLTLTRAQWRSRFLRRLLLQTFGLLPLLSGLATALLLWSRGATPGPSIIGPAIYVLVINLSLSLILATVVSLPAAIVGGAGVALAVGILGSMGLGDAAMFVVPTGMALAIGAAGSITALVTNDAAGADRRPAAGGLQLQIGSVVIGIVIGVVAVTGLRMTLTTLMAAMAGLDENTAYWLSRMLVVGLAFGLAGLLRRGRFGGLLVGLAAGTIYGLATLIAQSGVLEIETPLVSSGVLGGLAGGLLFGTSFGVTMALPYTLSDKIGGAWAGGWAGALGSWGRHVVRNQIPLWPTGPLGLIGIIAGIAQQWWRPLLTYPLTAAWNLILYRLDLRRADRPSLFHWHSAFWDEFQRLPLTGLDEHLLLFLERQPAEGEVALAYLSRSRQRWAAQAALLELEARRLAQLTTAPAIAQAHQHLPSGELAGEAQSLLREFTHLSRDIDAALNQTTHYHQRLALNTSATRLNSLARELTLSSSPYASRFQPIAERWQQALADYLAQLAAQLAHSQEIDNPYIVGVPLTTQQDIFVGRADIVARIEQLLLDPRRPPLLLYGQRRMGKTSLLRNLGRLLPQTILPLFVDGQRIALAGDYADFLYNLAREMERSAHRQRGLGLPSLDSQTLSNQPFTRFNDWLDAVEQALTGGGYRTALLALDEFEMLENALARDRFDETDILSMLRHMIQHRPAFKVMLTGSHPIEEFQRWASYLINVQVIKLGYLAPTEARQLIEQPIKDFPLRYQPQAVERILTLTRGHPALVQLLCYELVARKNEQPPAERRLVTVAEVEAVIPDVLANGRFFFADIQQNQVDAAGLALLRGLATHGENAVLPPAMLADFLPPTANLSDTLAHLCRRDLIESEGSGYRFQVELIRRWLAIHS